nr:ABC-three component system middle component 6 [Mycoplasmopsis bovis]
MYAEVKKPDNMPISIFLLSLDWLYLRCYWYYC